MNPIQAARKHCDCCQPSDLCLGITIADNLSLIRFRPENSKCLLLEPVKRCRHFEQCILPMEKRTEWAKDSRLSANLASDFKQAAHDYRIQTGYMAESVRLCPQCRTSKIGKGKKLCDKCRDSNKRKTQSQSDFKRHHAQNGSQHSNSSSISDVDSQ